MQFIKQSCSSLLLGAVATFGCGSTYDDPFIPDVTAEQSEVVRGVPDQGRHPAVVALEIAGRGLCTGTLIASDVVLTARHCLFEAPSSVNCHAEGEGPKVGKAYPPGEIRVFTGEEVTALEERARGRAAIVSPGDELCGEDIGLLILDREIKDVDPLVVSVKGVAEGQFVRAVGFGRSSRSGPAGAKLLRSHIRVLQTSATEFTVGQATCQGDSGGPAIDESSNKIVGVISRGAANCSGPRAYNIFTRTDAFHSLVDGALAHRLPYDADQDGGVRKKKKPNDPSDIGGPCELAEECSAGVCVTDRGTQYCSQTCGVHDHCPTGFRCTKLPGEGTQACTRK